MAQIVLGLGTSHGPQLSTPPDKWRLRVEADRAETAHPYRGATYGFDELAAMRAAEGLDERVTPDAMAGHAQRCAEAVESLAARLQEARVDVAIIVGNDQREVFGARLTPALWMYAGAEVADEPVHPERLAKLSPAIAISATAIKPAVSSRYPGHPQLAAHLGAALADAGFDLAQSDEMPQRGPGPATGMPHAFGFVYQRLMKGSVLPHVPFMLNTFYPPNQPRAARCMDFGRALAQAVAAWPQALRVALIASGGLSHFVIDETFDRALLDAMRRRDEDWLRGIDEATLQSGTSECKNWLPVAAACAEAGLEMELVDYVPCYRSHAGTGTAMAFAAWR
ncbi:protocatechuate 3,4-dioxygenase [Pigmentiphaga sp. YJ18]|uniref:DODA-type extradiol aromatic ring-opening family dioxygenase n=1 Tax=Pigmentiphaga sp. YJ18 TaxID=3134907 RepID=UPI00310E24F1